MELKALEQKLIDGLKAGDEISYNQLFNKYYILLTVFACKYVEDSETAREIVQDFFVHIFEIRNSLIITTSLSSYLYQSVRNRCLNHISQIKVREGHLENLKISEASVTNLEDKIIEAELEHQIYQIVSQLPGQCQKIFKMSRVDAKKNGEIANILNISIRTVETQISKALKILRQELKNNI